MNPRQRSSNVTEAAYGYFAHQQPTIATHRLRQLLHRMTLVIVVVVASLLGVVDMRRAGATSYHTIAIDGDCSDWSADEKFSANDGAQIWITWDATNIYLGWLGGGGSNQKRIAALDLNPDTDDTMTTINYSGVNFPLTALPDYVVEFSNFNLFFSTRTTNTFATQTNPAGTANFFSTNCSGQNFVEASVARSLFAGGSVAGLAPTDDLGVYGYFDDPTGGANGGYIYGGMPQGSCNPSGNHDQNFTCSVRFATTGAGIAPTTAGQVVTVLTVTSTADTGDSTPDGVCAESGVCTFREAIQEANASTGRDTIAFNIATAGTVTISPASSLPTITSPLRIDGYTQGDATENTLAVGNNAVLRIVLSGASAGIANGLVLGAGADGSTVRGLVINGFAGSGSGHGILLFLTSNNRIEGNFIGTDADGTTAVANGGNGVLVESANGNTIGGASAAARNVISGNRANGIAIANSSALLLSNYRAHGYAGGTHNYAAPSQLASSTIVQGNYIGTNPAGSAALGNGDSGVLIDADPDNLIGGVNVGEGNLISGNGADGITIVAFLSTGNVLQGNLIGTNASGETGLGNGGHGILLNDPERGAPSDTVIGGTGPGLPAQGNTIAYNASNGVTVDVIGPEPIGGTGNSIYSNNIFANDGIGIDLDDDTFDGDPVTPNDPVPDEDVGANRLQNFPVITSVRQGSTIVSGRLESAPDTDYQLEFFASPVGSPQTFLGTFEVRTGSNGIATFTDQVLPVTANVGDPVVATATDPEGNTSEFSLDEPTGDTTDDPPSFRLYLPFVRR